MSTFTVVVRRAALGAAALASGGVSWLIWGGVPAPRDDVPMLDSPPPRQQQISSLRSEAFDVLVVGGGATGCGVALDAATRGLKAALVEQDDFGSGTSSRSTKLVHGGVRYLEKAVFNLDYGQLKLVFEALHERRHMLTAAPHLTKALPIMTPCYSWWEIPYYWMGLKAYDLVASCSGSNLYWSRFWSAQHALRSFPTLAPASSNKSLKGTVIYYDGQMDDARLNVGLACTAAMVGAAVANHVKVKELLKNPSGRVTGAKCQDVLTGDEFEVKAKAVINATGPFVDLIRQLSAEDVKPIITPSAGVHVTLPDYYSAKTMGLIVPKTQDGRVLFMLPWQNATVAGTTDSKAELTLTPQPTEAEIQFILDEIGRFLTVKALHFKFLSLCSVRRSDVRSAWSGLRPLASDPKAADTQSISRDHVVTIDTDGLITVTGGKWTTYRRMAEDAVDTAVKQVGLKPPHECRTVNLRLVGAKSYHPALYTEVAQNYVVPHRPGAIDTVVAEHLARSYGDRAALVTAIAEQKRMGQRLVRGYPYIESEVVYACQREYCETACDFLARRTRLVFLDTAAAAQALPRVIDIMSEELGWDNKRRKQELESARKFLATFNA
eukprot:jgi/Chlat1/6797/Chrsp51S06494